MKHHSFLVAGFQMRVRKNIFEAAKAIAKALARASKKGARCLLTPEMILTGYHSKFDQRDRDKAIEEILAPACRKGHITLFVGGGNWFSGKKRLSKPYMETLVIGPKGEIVGAHRKVIPTIGDLQSFKRGPLSGLKTRKLEGVPYGLTICNDFWATPGYTSLPDPNLPLLWAKKGAKVIFHSIASGYDRGQGPRYLDFHTRRMQDSAARNHLWVVSANAVSDPQYPVNAPSGIIGPDGLWKTNVPTRGERFFVGRISL